MTDYNYFTNSSHKEIKAMNLNNLFYGVGLRDAYANVLSIVRTNGLEEGLRLVAEELLKADPEHPHATWFLSNKK